MQGLLFARFTNSCHQVLLSAVVQICKENKLTLRLQIVIYSTRTVNGYCGSR